MSRVCSWTNSWAWMNGCRRWQDGIFGKNCSQEKFVLFPWTFEPPSHLPCILKTSLLKGRSQSFLIRNVNHTYFSFLYFFCRPSQSRVWVIINLKAPFERNLNFGRQSVWCLLGNTPLVKTICPFSLWRQIKSQSCQYVPYPVVCLHYRKEFKVLENLFDSRNQGHYSVWNYT